MKSPDNFGIALANAEMGVVSIPIAAGSKSPPLVKWKQWQGEMPPAELLRAWFKNTRVNIAIICSGMVVFDCESLAVAELVLAECGPTSHALKTPRGVHLGYRRRKGVAVANRVKIKGMDIDIRTDGGLEMIPNSRTAEGEYRWLGEGLKPIADLPVAKIGWTRERTKRVLQPIGPIDEADAMVRRARAYASHVEGAVSGDRGHDKTFRLACKLTHLPPVGFGLCFDQALAILREWSESSCDPPWSLAELEHKVADAIKKR